MIIPHSALNTPLCTLTGVKYPIVQPGMGWVSDGRLTAATARAGGLGVIGSATMSFEQLANEIAFVKDHASQPFGVNLRSDSPDVVERADLMIREGVRVATFALAPSESLVKKLKDAGLICIPSIGAVRHAEKLAGWGVDAVTVQGGEAGGHTGAVATTVLLPQIVGGVDVPVIAAGGFFDGRGLVAALSYGAAGIAMGTRFLMTEEAPVPDNVKAEYRKKQAGETVVTSQIDGHPHRVLRTEFIDDLVNTPPWKTVPKALVNAWRLKATTGIPLLDMLKQAIAMRRDHDYSWSQLVMAANTPVLLSKTMVDGEVEHGILSGGQCVGVISDIPSCEELIAEIISGANGVLEGFAQ